MNTFAALYKALRAAGWQCDTGEECFFDGAKRLDYRKVQALVPGMTLDELASYQDDRRDKWRRAKKKAAKKVARKKG
jgi:hypothetical protein